MDDIIRFDNTDNGFTMIEVIIVLIIIGIISAVAATRIGSTTSFTALAEAGILKSNLRYAQLRALGDDKTWGMSFGTNSYTLCRDGNIANINLPNENSAIHILPSGITVSGNTIAFNEWGSPGTADIVINVTGGGGVITITGNTGFIR